MWRRMLCPARWVRATLITFDALNGLCPSFINSPDLRKRPCDSKGGDPLVRIRSRTQTVFQLAFTGTRRYNVATEINRGGRLSMKTQIPNINALRSAWRRVKKDIKDAIIRDLTPVKDVKGGGVTGESHHRRRGAPGSRGRHS